MGRGTGLATSCLLQPQHTSPRSPQTERSVSSATREQKPRTRTPGLHRSGQPDLPPIFPSGTGSSLAGTAAPVSAPRGRPASPWFCFGCRGEPAAAPALMQLRALVGARRAKLPRGEACTPRSVPGASAQGHEPPPKHGAQRRRSRKRACVCADTHRLISPGEL